MGSRVGRAITQLEARNIALKIGRDVDERLKLDRWSDGLFKCRFTVYGQCYSQKNSKIARRNGFPIKHAKAHKFETDFIYQVPVKYRDLKLGSMKEPLRAIVTVFYPSYRQDLSVEIVYDLLQKAGVISNDRWVREKHEYAEVDKRNPRVEVTVEAI